MSVRRNIIESRDINIAACRLLMVLIPGLEALDEYKCVRKFLFY